MSVTAKAAVGTPRIMQGDDAVQYTRAQCGFDYTTFTPACKKVKITSLKKASTKIGRAKKINSKQNSQTNRTLIYQGVVFGDWSANLMKFADQVDYSNHLF